MKTILAKIPSLLCLGWLALGLTSLVGCKSADEPGSMSTASVQIGGRSVEEIKQVAIAVFRQENYANVLNFPEELVFERPGSRSDALKWGGLAGDGVTMRVKVGLTEMLNGGYLLQADVFAVQNSAEPMFRTESRTLFNREPYQKLLKEVARRLNQPK